MQSGWRFLVGAFEAEMRDVEPSWQALTTGPLPKALQSDEEWIRREGRFILRWITDLRREVKVRPELEPLVLIALRLGAAIERNEAILNRGHLTRAGVQRAAPSGRHSASARARRAKAQVTTWTPSSDSPSEAPRASGTRDTFHPLARAADRHRTTPERQHGARHVDGTRPEVISPRTLWITQHLSAIQSPVMIASLWRNAPVSPPPQRHRPQTTT